VAVNSCNTVITRYQLIESRIGDKFELTPRTNANVLLFNFSVTNVSLNLNIEVVQLADSAFAASTNSCFRPRTRTKVGQSVNVLTRAGLTHIHHKGLIDNTHATCVLMHVVGRCIHDVNSLVCFIYSESFAAYRVMCYDIVTQPSYS